MLTGMKKTLASSLKSTVQSHYSELQACKSRSGTLYCQELLHRATAHQTGLLFLKDSYLKLSMENYSVP